MKSIKTAGIFLLFLIFLSCREDEKELVSIVGKWRGVLAELEVKPFGVPLPISQKDENFATELEFTSEGTVILLNESPTVTGTYQLIKDQLITDIDFNLEMIDPADPYTVQELTKSTLIIYLEKTDTFQHPDTGNSITGDIKITLHFERF
jgi:hypothetical protein